MIDNYKDFIEFCQKLNNRPKLLLHSCCAPCSSHTMMVLKRYFEFDIYYSNDNIFPEDEFYKRLSEQQKLSNIINPQGKVIDDGYNDSDYYNAVSGLENLGEHSKRCYECYKLRLRKTALKAKELGYDYFTTTLSISPYKDSGWINEIGYELEKEIGIKYLYSNFKKEEGYKNSIKLSLEYDLYRQDYCGCVYSLRERDERVK